MGATRSLGNHPLPRPLRHRLPTRRAGAHREVAWVRGLPFSLLKHPHYVGTLLSIWGFFVLMRFPHGDWIVLPLLETAYYAIGAYYEV